MDGGAGGLLSMGLQRVGHDQATKYSTESGGGSWTKQVGVMKDASLLDLRLVLTSIFILGSASPSQRLTMGLVYDRPLVTV